MQRVKKLEKVKDNLHKIVKQQAEKIAKMQMKKLERQKRITKEMQENQKIRQTQYLVKQGIVIDLTLFSDKKNQVKEKHEHSLKQMEMTRYETYKKDIKEVTKRLQE